MNPRRERNLLRLFDIGLVIKAIDGALEAIGALVILFVRPGFVLRVVEFATGGELAQDPDDHVATWLHEAGHAFAVHTHYLVALYLFAHGVIKIVLVYGIFTKRKYAYQAFICALAVFAAYEAYRAIDTRNWLLAALAVFDVLLMGLAAHEYGVRRRLSAEGGELAIPRPADPRGA